MAHSSNDDSSSSTSSYEEIDDVVTVSSYESLEVRSASSYEDEEVVLQESEYETVEEEIVVSDYVTDSESEENDTPSGPKSPVKAPKKKMEKSTPTTCNDKPNRTKKSAPMASNNASTDPKSDKPVKKDSAPSAPSSPRQMPSMPVLSSAGPMQDDEESDNKSERDEDDAQDADDEDEDQERKNKKGKAGDKKEKGKKQHGDKVWHLPDGEMSPTNNEKPVVKMTWNSKDYYRGDSNCFNAWKQFRSKDYVEKLEKEKKLKRIERREIVAKRVKVKERMVQTVRKKKDKPPRTIKVRNTKQIVQKKRVKKQKEAAPPFDEMAFTEPIRLVTTSKGNAPPPLQHQQEAEMKRLAKKEAMNVEKEQLAKEKEKALAKEKEKAAAAAAAADAKRLEAIRKKAEERRLEEERLAAEKAAKEKRLEEEERLAAEEAAKEKRLEEERKKEKEKAAQAKAKRRSSLAKSKKLQDTAMPPPTPPQPSEFAEVDIDKANLAHAESSSVYTALSVKGLKTEPTMQDYLKLAQKTKKYFGKELKRAYGKAFVDILVDVKDTKFQAAIPNEEYNIYVEWDVRSRFNKEQVKGNSIPSDTELTRRIVDFLSMEYIDYVCELKKTPFARTQGLFMQQVHHESKLVMPE